jgi:hypothetical protein
LSQRLQVTRVRNHDSGLTLYRLNQDRHDIAIILGNRADRIDIVVGYAHEARYQRFETGLHLATAGGAQGRHGATMETVLHPCCITTICGLSIPC